MNRPLSTTAARQGTLREHNLALVAHAVVDSAAPLSRADVATTTGLTRATVSALVDRLVEARLLRELPPATPQRAGRPAVPLTPAPRTVVGLGLEVNVDYLGGQVLDLTGAPIARRVEPADLHGSDPAQTLARLRTIALSLHDDVARDGMTVAGAQLALPGLVAARTGRLQVAPNLGWTQLDPVPILDLPVPVKVANEAKLAAIAQIGRPGGASPRTFLYVSGDVGIGSAIVVDGQLFQGRHGWTGEIGHVVVDPAGPSCPCGASGCLERFAGKDALLRGAGLRVDDDAADLARLLDAEDPAARAAVSVAADALGSALADYINLVDIDTVLLGGLFAALFPRLHGPLMAALSNRVLCAPWASIDVRTAPVARDAAMIGGAREVLGEVLDNPSAWVS